MCGHQAERQKAIRHISNILNNLKKSGNTGQNVGFYRYLNLGKPRKQFKILIFAKIRGESFPYR